MEVQKIILADGYSGSLREEKVTNKVEDTQIKLREKIGFCCFVEKAMTESYVMRKKEDVKQDQLKRMESIIDT